MVFIVGMLPGMTIGQEAFKNAPLVALINPPVRFAMKNPISWSAIPPLWAASLSATMVEIETPHQIVDMTGEALGQVWELGPGAYRGMTPTEGAAAIDPRVRLIGISNMFSAAWPMVRHLVEVLARAHPQALIVLGGEHPTALPEVVLNETAAHAVVMGEGEEIFLELLARLQAATGSAVEAVFGGVTGVAWKDSGGQVHREPRRGRIREVDSLPRPNWEKVPVENYFSKKFGTGAMQGAFLPILATRGCPYQCTYCTSPNMWTTRWVARDPVAVVDEMAALQARYGVSDFQFCDLTAILNKKWVGTFCEELIRRDLKVSWQMPTGTRSEAFDEDMARLMKRSGLHQFAFAMESGDKEILSRIQKKLDPERQLAASRAAIRAGMNVVMFFIVGFPFEKPRHRWNTFKAVMKSAWIGILEIGVHPFVPMPGTVEFANFAEQPGFKLDDSYYESLMNWLTIAGQDSYAEGMSAKRMRWFIAVVFAAFYVVSFVRFPGRFVREIVTAWRKNRGSSRFARWIGGYRTVKDVRMVTYAPEMVVSEAPVSGVA